jgi:ABC-type uncharacterized transport system ATPase subunit
VIVNQSVHSLRSGFIRKKLLVLETVEAEVPFALDGVRVLRRGPHRLELEVDLRVSPVERVIEAVLRVARVRDLTVTDPPMDEIVQAIYATAPLEAVP